jgi:hypothetical protein
LSRAAPQIEYQLPLLAAKVDLPRLARQGHRDELVVESRRTSQASRANLKIEEGRANSRKAEKETRRSERKGEIRLAETRRTYGPKQANVKISKGGRSPNKFQEGMVARRPREESRNRWA